MTQTQAPQLPPELPAPDKLRELFEDGEACCDEQIAVDCMNDFLRDVAGFDANQLLFVHCAIERAGLSLTLETEQ